MTTSPARCRTLDDLLAVLPGLRRRRNLDADLLRLLLDRQAGQCTWCGEPVSKGRLKWCGDDCVADFKARCCAETQRSIVENRDQGVCQLCRRDTIKSEQEFKAIEDARRKAGELPYGWQACEVILKPIMAGLGYARGQWREVDHDPPVAEYGGLCDPKQLRLLCGACHADETKKLAGRRKRTTGAKS